MRLAVPVGRAGAAGSAGVGVQPVGQRGQGGELQVGHDLLVPPVVRFAIDPAAAQAGAREHGAAKPEASIFLAACARLEHAPDQVLHVGDHVEMDVAGAARAGLRSCWINREARHWQHAEIVPDLQFTTLTALADWLDAHAA